MEINADFSQRAAVHAAHLAWTPSPMPGVERRMLDRVGEEVARATSIVRYAPGSRFSAHMHGGGEEFLVLDGSFTQAGEVFEPQSWMRLTNGAELDVIAGASGCRVWVKEALA